MILSNHLEVDVGKTICQETSTALDTRVRYAKRFFHMKPNESNSQHFGFLMLKGTEVRIDFGLNYEAITKEIRNYLAA